MKFWEKGTQGKFQATSRNRKISNVYISRRTQMVCTNAEGVSRETTAFISKKLVIHAHLKTLHGGLSLTVAKIREKYWIPRLRGLTKRVINECHGCKRFHVTALANPPTGNLPKERTEGSEPKVHRSRLCWVYQVLQQEEKGDEGIYSTICM